MIDPSDIDAVARRLCEHLGFEPDERVEASEAQGATRAEERSSGRWFADMILAVPRWTLYRRDAELAIASQRAMRDLVSGAIERTGDHGAAQA